MQATIKSGKIFLPVAAGKYGNRARRRMIRDAVKVRLLKIRQDMAKARTEVKDRHKTLGYIEWLKRDAEQGNIPAIHALRKRGAVAPALVNITARNLRDMKLIANKIAHVSGRVTLFYKAGEDVFRDNGSHLSLKLEVSDHGIKAALLIAMAKFGGQALMVNGSDELKAKSVQVAVRDIGFYVDP